MRIQNIEQNASATTSRPKVAHIIWNDPIYVSGNGTFQDELISMAGGTNAFANKPGWTNVGVEDFIAADPDILIVNSGSGMGGTEDSVAQYFENDTRFANVAAIRNHRVYVIDSDVVDRATGLWTLLRSLRRTFILSVLKHRLQHHRKEPRDLTPYQHVAHLLSDCWLRYDG